MRKRWKWEVNHDFSIFSLDDSEDLRKVWDFVGFLVTRILKSRRALWIVSRFVLPPHFFCVQRWASAHFHIHYWLKKTKHFCSSQVRISIFSFRHDASVDLDRQTSLLLSSRPQCEFNLFYERRQTRLPKNKSRKEKKKNSERRKGKRALMILVKGISKILLFFWRREIHKGLHIKLMAHTCTGSIQN